MIYIGLTAISTTLLSALVRSADDGPQYASMLVDSGYIVGPSTTTYSLWQYVRRTEFEHISNTFDWIRLYPVPLQIEHTPHDSVSTAVRFRARYWLRWSGSKKVVDRSGFCVNIVLIKPISLRRAKWQLKIHYTNITQR